MDTKLHAQKRMLVCLAHPDDESFGIGGSIAYYAERGVEIHLICATRGEAGTVDEKHLAGFESIAELRESELNCAAEALGIRKIIFLDYRDSGMLGSEDNKNENAFINAPRDEVAEKIVREIRDFKPHVVTTFDSTGGYYHPDHIAIHKATVEAFQKAGKASRFPNAGKAYSPDYLYFNARSRKRMRRFVKLMSFIGRDPKRFGRNKDIDLTKLANDNDTPAHVTINYRSVGKQKDKADQCHASQLGENGLSLSSIIRFFWLLGAQNDHFTRAFPSTRDDFRSKDLFDL